MSIQFDCTYFSACSLRPGSHGTHSSTLPATLPIAIPTVVVGRHDLSLKANGMQDLEELADVKLLGDIRSEGVREAHGGPQCVELKA